MVLKNPFRLAKERVKTLFRHHSEPAAVILMYHRISYEAIEPNWLAVSPSNFAQHLEYLRQAYHPVRLLDLVESLQNGSVSHRAVAVTFDDGYSNNLTQALPLLESAQIPATVFVTSGHIDSLREFWWDELSRIIMLSPNVPQSLLLTVQGYQHKWDTTSPKQRQEAYLALKELIKPLPAAARDDVMNELADWSGLKPTLRSDYRTMTTGELKQLAQSEYIDIGAHTMTHSILPTLSPEAQYDEVVDSRRCLEAIINEPVGTFSYPNGDYTDKTAKLVEDAGFRGACTTSVGCVKPGDDLFRLQRCIVHDWDIDTFKQKLEVYFHSCN